MGRGKPPAGSGWQGTPGASAFIGYTVLYPFTGRDEATSLGQPHDSLTYLFQLTCVGATQDQAETVMDRARIALVGVTPSVSDRAAFPIYQAEVDRQVTRDDAATPPVHYGIAQFRFRSNPLT